MTTWNRKLDPFEMHDATNKARPPPPRRTENTRLDCPDAWSDMVERTTSASRVTDWYPPRLLHVLRWVREG